jgi:hypothetical protein
VGYPELPEIGRNGGRGETAVSCQRTHSNSPPKPAIFSDSSSNHPSLAASRRPSLPPSPAASLRARANAVNLRRNCKWSAPDLSFSGSSSLAIHASHLRSLQESAKKQLHSYQDNVHILFRRRSLRALRLRQMCQQMPDAEEPTVPLQYGTVQYCTCRAMKSSKAGYCFVK